MGRGNLLRLTSLRALAALTIFAYHLGPAAHIPGGGKFSSGYVGVSFFYVLSGFILVWALSPQETARDFYRRRLARIYPSHLAMLIVFAVALTFPVPRSPGALALSLTLTQSWAVSHDGLIYSYNPAAWSLSCEAFFYLLFPWIVTSLRGQPRGRMLAWVGALALLGAAGAVAGGLRAGPAGDMAFTFPLLRLPEFVLGVAAGLLVTDGWRPRINLPLAAGAVVAIYLVLEELAAPKPLADAVLPLPFCALILAAASADLSGRPGWLLTRRPCVYAGEISFCFYLVHYAVIVLVARHLHGVGAAGVDLVVSALGAALLHHLVEIPAQRLLRGGRTPVPASDSLAVAVE
jgi:peptidoglycan/LPS O-acetylase OafA/YrhL